MNVRLTSVVGALAVLVGLAIVFARGLASGLTPEWALVVLVGVLAVVQGARFAQGRRRTELQETETADPEKRYDAPTPGDDVEESLAVAGRWSRAGRMRRRQLRERLSAAAVRAVIDEAGCSREEAARRIRSGEWTDDPVAAAFVSSEVGLSTSQRARLLVRARSPLGQYRLSFARTVRVVEELTAVDYAPREDEATDGSAAEPSGVEP